MYIFEITGEIVFLEWNAPGRGDKNRNMYCRNIQYTFVHTHCAAS